MKKRALLKALQFAFIPTISILLLLCFAFFSIEKTVDFISSDTQGAMALRIAAFIIEVVFILFLYLINLKQFEEEEEKQKLKDIASKVVGKRLEVANTRWVEDCFLERSNSYNTIYSVIYTEDPNTVTLQKTPKY